MRILVNLVKKLAAQGVTVLVRSGFTGLGISLLKIEHGLSRKPRHQQLLALSSVTRGTAALSAEKSEIYPNRAVWIGPVRRCGAGADPSAADQRAHEVKLPAMEITTFHDIRVVGGTEMLCADDDQLLYDELALGDPARYGCKVPEIIPAHGFGLHLPACKDGRVLVRYFCSESPPIPRAIHLCKDHSTNYFHWLLECLPRAIVALGQPAYSAYPLLVDAGLPKQCIEALQRISGGREIIRIDHAEMRGVKHLVFPGVFSFMRDNYGGPVSAEDLVIAPEAVELVRATFLPRAAVRPWRKLYVTRDRAGYRRLLNEPQIQAQLLAQGFEIVRPEALGFSEQVELFSAAALIVGPTGAGMTNMVFAPPGCKVVVLAGATRNANTFIFGQLGQLLDQKLMYVMGEPRKPRVMHSDFSIDLQHLDDALALLGEDSDSDSAESVA